MGQIVPIHFPSPTQTSNLQLVPICLALATTRHTNNSTSLEAPPPSHWASRFPNGTLHSPHKTRANIPLPAEIQIPINSAHKQPPTKHIPQNQTLPSIIPY